APSPAQRVSVRGSTLDADSTASGDSAGGAGDVAVHAFTVAVSNHGFISADTVDGDGGDVAVYADTVVLFEDGSISSLSSGRGDSGAVTVAGFPQAGDGRQLRPASLITMDSGASISVDSRASGDTGLIRISANAVLMIGGATISASSQDGANSSSGIVLLANDLFVADATINVSTQGSENASLLFILGTDSELSDPIVARPANSIVLSIGSEVSTASTSPQANAGRAAEIFLLADSIALEGAAILGTTSAGEGGQISLFGERIELRNQSIINTSTAGAGSAGRIELGARVEGTVVDITQSTVSSDSSASGSAGDVEVRASSLAVLDAQISSAASASGGAGSITVSGDDFVLSSGALVVSSQQSRGGSISLRLSNDLRIEDAVVSAASRATASEAPGGNIVIGQPNLAILNRSQLSADANAGAGGNIDLRAQTLVRSADTLITATSASNIDGRVAIEAVDDLNVRVLEVPSPQVQAPVSLAGNCDRRPGTKASTLVVEAVSQSMLPNLIGQDTTVEPANLIKGGAGIGDCGS
ncbi:MAG: hypothetical protein AAGF46_12705, partial [Pseudomonadota bacterium]